jgi:hypothetical protein
MKLLMTLLQPLSIQLTVVYTAVKFLILFFYIKDETVQLMTIGKEKVVS